MDPKDVGRFLFCPACGRPASPPWAQDTLSEDWEEWRCTCCKRPWTACPCSPASDGACKAEKPESDKTNVDSK